jgi:hypothetical protein
LAGSGQGSFSGSGAPTPVQNICPDGIARTSRTIPRVILVLDGSCSMSTPYPANGAQSSTMCTPNPNGRWTALRNALLGPNGVVTRLAPVVEFGVGVFGTTRQCPFPETPLNPMVNNLSGLTNAIPELQPGNYTPAGLALAEVNRTMLLGPSPDGENRPQIVVLATDGEPNSCDNADPNYQPSVDAVNEAFAMGAKTYVVSLADATGPFHDHLQQLADLGVGGAGTLYEPNNPAALEAALSSLIGGAVGCDITLNGVVLPGQECNGNITFDGAPLTCNTDYVLTDPSHIQLQGEWCNRLMASGNAVVAADFPCESFDVR